ncbi:hypothetical protein BTZ20_3946 [Rhodococcus sp. MTM3W5.2]|uniref:hypothetical protein n=1 Tax=Rhodococcus sp. MTM3W5.2 TaxID=1805827 RepID=UPI0009791271|nr:hypothetical protein [Rhodococcus sp. MTM3W5.2]AQA24309.1 hypothetical protein BTZ20_3946 [Rhodococcus sp. MTM3W5.2]
MTLQEQLTKDGFVHIEGFLDVREIDYLLEFSNSIGHGTGAGYLGRRLVTAIDDPSGITASVQEKIKQLQIDLFGYHMTLTQSALFSVDPDAPEQSANFPFHQEHGSFYDLGEHLRYTNLYIVLDKAETAESNVTVIPFSELARIEPDLHELAVGAGAARYTAGMRFDDNTGSYVSFRADLESIAQTPQLSAGDLLVLRGDIIHRTQNQKCRRTAISIRTVAPDVECHRNVFDICCGTKLAFMLGDSKYFGTRDFIFEDSGLETMTAEQLQHGRNALMHLTEPTDKATRVAEHISAFSAKLQGMQKSLQAAARG